MIVDLRTIANYRTITSYRTIDKYKKKGRSAAKKNKSRTDNFVEIEEPRFSKRFRKINL